MENVVKRKYEFITWYRVFAVICILLCHYVPESSNPYVAMTSQFFNIGVEIFFIISGFCFGIQGGEVTNDRKSWYKRRIKRIYVPYEIFLICLAIIYMIVGKTLNVKNWLTCILGIQGANVGVLGADHTWFITVLLLCYLVTPFISTIWNKISKKSYESKILLVMGLFLVKIVFALFPHPSVNTILSSVSFYIIAYFCGREFNNPEIHLRTAIISFGVICSSFTVRIISRWFCDGTILYDRIIVGYTQYIAAFSFLVLFMYLFKDRPLNKIGNFINRVSFEVYLCHYMFVAGPISLIHITPYLLVNIIIVTCISFASATLLHWVSGNILKIIK